ncbi:MAG: hypothetical protein SF123_13155 [Chloroflexota bacterium]|nr:hypothetical protein [Chloroflexota bacterium]
MPVPAFALRFLNHYAPNNALASVEANYLARHSQQSTRILRFIAALLRWGGLMLGLILAGGVLAGSLLQRDAYPVGEQLEQLPAIFLFSVLIAHFVVQFRTVMLSSSSIAREREHNNWELLILTGVSARTIVRGKWRAVVQRQLPTYLWLAALRACAVVWYGFFLSNESRRFYLTIYGGDYFVVLPEPGTVIFAGAIIILLTLLNLPLTAACALVGGAVGKNAATALSRGIAIRALVGLVPGIVYLIALGVFGYLFRETGFTNVVWMNGILTWVGVLPLTLADNGVTIGSTLSQVQIYSTGYDYRQSSDTLWLMVSAAIAFVPIYIWMIGGVLRWAERRVVMRGALR